jgi:hypothetical protein
LHSRKLPVGLPSVGRLFACGSSGYTHSVYAFAPTLRRPAISCFDCLPEQDESVGRSATCSSILRTSPPSGRSCSRWIGWRQKARGKSRRCEPVTPYRTRSGENYRRDGTERGTRSGNLQTETFKIEICTPASSRRMRSIMTASGQSPRKARQSAAPSRASTIGPIVPRPSPRPPAHQNVIVPDRWQGARCAGKISSCRTMGFL